MTNKEYKIIRNRIQTLLGQWHRCALRAEELMPEDKARGLKVGQVCDECRISAEIETKIIIEEIKQFKNL